MYVLTSGQIPPNPSELLGSAEMKDLIDRLELAFDLIVIDAPPLLPVTDAAVLSQYVSGVVVVVSAQRVRQNDLEKSLKALELVGSKTLGVILNRLPVRGPDAYAYTYYGESSNRSNKGKLVRGSKLARNRQARFGYSQTDTNDKISDERRAASLFPSGKIGR